MASIRVNPTQRWRLTTALLLGLAILFSVFVPPTRAVPAGVSFSRTLPLDGSTLLVAQTASNNPLDPPTFQLKAEVWLNNSSSTDHAASFVEISYPGSGIAPTGYVPWQFPDGVATFPAIVAGDESVVAVYDGLDRDLPLPLPKSVNIKIYLDIFDPDPIELNYNLALRDNTVPFGAFFFPAKASDLEKGELWAFGTRHVVDSGGGGASLNPSVGSQKYALDMDVVRWTGSSWTSRFDGTDGTENDDFLVWNKPLYAMHDGTIIACYRGESDHQPGGFDDVTFENTFGNSLSIQHGNDIVAFAHFRNGTIPDDLCPADGQNNALNIPVVAGQFLGRVGNTGRSTAPHIHFQVNYIPPTLPDTQGGVPMQFMNVRALADETSINNLGGSPDLKPLAGMTLHKHSLVLPNPCGFEPPPAGAAEVARHGIPEECYQDVFTMIVSKGYSPKFVDAYDVNGSTYFNAIFRPEGPQWAAFHGLTGDQYQTNWNIYAAAGYRPHQVDSYITHGEVRYAAIFEKRSGPLFAGFHGLTDTEYADEVADLAALGYAPINISTVEVGGNAYWTGLLEKVTLNGWWLETPTAANYQTVFDTQVDAALLPIYVHGLSYAGSPFITGIWINPIPGDWAAAHGLTGTGYQTAWETQTSSGKLTRAVTGYDNGAGVANFAAVWRKPVKAQVGILPPRLTTERTARFTFTSDDPFGTFECRLDRSAYAPCESPVLLEDLPIGPHSFSVRALDRDSASDAPTTVDWFVAGAICDGLAATIFGTPGDDEIDGTPGDDVIAGLEGDDEIDGKGGNDVICGGPGADHIDGRDGNDRIFGNEGPDRIYGGDGNDHIEGGDGDDVVYGGEGDDLLLGNGGNDRLKGDGGADAILGGEGNDTLEGKSGNDRLVGEAGDDRLYGDDGDDSLDGGEGDDSFYAGDGNDHLAGGTGADRLRGEAGDDTCDGGVDGDTDVASDCEIEVNVP